MRQPTPQDTPSCVYLKDPITRDILLASFILFLINSTQRFLFFKTNYLTKTDLPSLLNGYLYKNSIVLFCLKQELQ